MARVELTPEQIAVIDAFNRNEYIDVPAHKAATIFPAMRELEFKELVADIKARGQEQHIILHQTGTIIDGVHRFKACREAKCQPKFKPWDGKLGDEIAYVISANLHRRHLSDNQRAAIGAEFCNLKQGRPKQANSPDITQNEMASRLNVSARSIRTARRVIKEGPPRVAALLKQDKISLRAGEAATKLSDEEKAHFASMTEEEALLAANNLTRKRASTPTPLEALIGSVSGFGVLWTKANDQVRGAMREWIQQEANAAVLEALEALLAPESLVRKEE
jgi:ParB-like chromosome segregation protein Spo0J